MDKKIIPANRNRTAGRVIGTLAILSMVGAMFELSTFLSAWELIGTVAKIVYSAMFAFDFIMVIYLWGFYGTGKNQVLGMACIIYGLIFIGGGIAQAVNFSTLNERTMHEFTELAYMCNTSFDAVRGASYITLGILIMLPRHAKWLACVFAALIVAAGVGDIVVSVMIINNSVYNGVTTAADILLPLAAFRRPLIFALMVFCCPTSYINDESSVAQEIISEQLVNESDPATT